MWNELEQCRGFWHNSSLGHVMVFLALLQAGGCRFLEVPLHFLLVIRSSGATAPHRSLASDQIRHTDANTADRANAI